MAMHGSMNVKCTVCILRNTLWEHLAQALATHVRNIFSYRVYVFHNASMKCNKTNTVH